MPIFACASLSPFQKIKINFGHKKFKFCPDNYNCKTLYSLLEQNNNEFQVFEKVINSKWSCNATSIHLFKIFQANKYAYFFKDSEQNKYDEILKQIKLMINKEKNWKTIISKFSKQLDKEIDNTKCLRFIQSTIEIIDLEIKENEFHAFAFCIFSILKTTAAKIEQNSFHVFIFHYVNILQQNSEIQTKIKIQNFCIVLIFYSFKMCCDFASENCIIFLSEMYKEFSTDNLIQLYSLIALTNFYKTTKIFSEKLFNSEWQTKFNFNNELEKVKKTEKYTTQLQLYLCANNYPKFKNQNISQLSNILSENENFFEMNPCDKNDLIKLSPSNLMVRNDNISTGYIRSKFSVNPGIFYFEVIILTAGPMVIGLAAKKRKIENEIGQNSFSLGIDGYNQCVKMNNLKYDFKNYKSQWKIGDIIGIFFDSSQPPTVKFAINNKVIELNGDPLEEGFIFSELAYHVAVSLDTFQQCYFNFNANTPIYMNSSPLNQISENLSQTKISNSLVNFHSNNQTRDVFIGK